MTNFPMPNGYLPRCNALPPAVVACLLYLAIGSPHLAHWDSYDYLKQIVTHRLSDLGFGRPFFIGYNIVLWEATKKTFGLISLQAESVVATGTILLGGIGVLHFWRLTRKLLPLPACQMAALGLLLSPMYALYSGTVMTEIPMLVALMSAAAVLWNSDPGSVSRRDLAGGLLFGIAVGIREQAVTLAGAFLWILWVQRQDVQLRLRALMRFGITALAVVLAPLVWLFLQDPTAFTERTRIWLSAIPMGEIHFGRNVQASILYLFAVCPGAWLGLAGAGIYRWLWRIRAPARRTENGRTNGVAFRSIPSPIWGFICCLALPLAALWRDADVQIHPRYLLITLPASLVFCVSLYCRWMASRRAAATWILLQVAVFALAILAFQPFRQLQSERREYAQSVRKSVSGDGLLIAGTYSPIFDYYRALGDRPNWQILWSGWRWNRESAAAIIADSWFRRRPVYLCDGPAAWLFFEEQRLDLHLMLGESRREEVAPGLLRIHPK